MATPIKQSPTVRISEKSHNTLRELSARYGEPMQNVLDQALESYRRRKFFEEVNSQLADLAQDPAAWAEYRKELTLYEGTLMDGLDPVEVWTDADFVPKGGTYG